jgi:L-rhamnose mutarotase
MQAKLRALGALTGLFALAALVGADAAAADRPYTEGAVVNVAAVRTEPGMFDEYMKYLAGPYKQSMEEQKKAGIILDYSVYAATPRSPNDPDLYLITVYKNMAALDDLNARTDPISEKIWGSMDQQTQATITRGKLRTLLGDEYIRELKLK